MAHPSYIQKKTHSVSQACTVWKACCHLALSASKLILSYTCRLREITQTLLCLYELDSYPFCTLVSHTGPMPWLFIRFLKI